MRPGELGVLSILNVHGETSAADLRHGLGWLSPPDFYLLMSYLEDCGKVTVRTETRDVDGMKIDVLWYSEKRS